MVDFYAGIENIDAFSTIHSVFDIDYIPFAIWYCESYCLEKMVWLLKWSKKIIV